MSKSFLKISEAYTKLGLSGGGTNWIRKSELIATGKCDTTKLTKYGNNDFVVDDDIIIGSTLPILYAYSGTSTGDNGKTLPRVFNPSKPFKITGDITFSSISGGVGAGITIYNSNHNDTSGVLDVSIWGSGSIPNYINNNTMKYNYGGWIGDCSCSAVLNKVYHFELEYDGKVYKRNVGGTIDIQTISLCNDDCNKIMFSGSPWWSGRSCTVTISNLVIRQ